MSDRYAHITKVDRMSSSELRARQNFHREIMVFADSAERQTDQALIDYLIRDNSAINRELERRAKLLDPLRVLLLAMCVLAFGAALYAACGAYEMFLR